MAVTISTRPQKNGKELVFPLKKVSIKCFHQKTQKFRIELSNNLLSYIILGGSNIYSSCESDHLTSFGTGYFPAPNTIDFEYMMVEFDVADNVTIFMVLVVTTVLFVIALIWAKCKDSRDIDEQKPHWVKDNLVEDHYFYEVPSRIPSKTITTSPQVVVQTGNMLSHGTESKVQMILTGEENATQVRTLSDPEKPRFFKKGRLDSFLLSVDKPLGHLQYLQVS